jgi:hypothetical protein
MKMYSIVNYIGTEKKKNSCENLYVEKLSIFDVAKNASIEYQL